MSAVMPLPHIAALMRARTACDYFREIVTTIWDVPAG